MIMHTRAHEITSATQVLTCPACGNDTLAVTDESVNLDQIMKRWRDHGAAFSAETLARYSTRELGPLHLYTCRTCQFGQYQPIVVGNADFYGAIGQIEYYTENKWEFDRSIEFIRRERPHTVIDVGCGSGFFLDQLRKAMPSIKLVGIEINEAAASQARARGHHVEVLDWDREDFAQALPFKADVVVCHQVLEHVQNPIQLLKSIRTMLTESGLAVISTPDSEGLVGRQSDSLTEQPPHHVTKWNEAAFRAALPRAGFRAVRAYYEPLPKILWPGYFPTIWQANGWPSIVGRAAAQAGNLGGEGMNWLASLLEQRGISYLHGAGGHTILVTARPQASQRIAATGRDASEQPTPSSSLPSLVGELVAKIKARRAAARLRHLQRSAQALVESVDAFIAEAQSLTAGQAPESDHQAGPAVRQTTLDALAQIALEINERYERLDALERSALSDEQPRARLRR
ncbi:Methyltransferase type 12 [Rhodopseudomonas palustris TIE-1]|uniref:class I SAM-dependent methyltransferase n=1 Tax=Rhodopseudomonas palustris TaxID=1076 RepID=UPI00016494E7|nr:methyltransferase domain-containing protein [Rhodopseudomonas palustris]ACF03082.1 Methyltransferase type 12 [Rhodopseudomonas palustris TIE-1]